MANARRHLPAHAGGIMSPGCGSGSEKSPLLCSLCRPCALGNRKRSIRHRQQPRATYPNRAQMSSVPQILWGAEITPHRQRVMLLWTCARRLLCEQAAVARYGVQELHPSVHHIALRQFDPALQPRFKAIANELVLANLPNLTRPDRINVAGVAVTPRFSHASISTRHKKRRSACPAARQTPAAAWPRPDTRAASMC